MSFPKKRQYCVFLSGFDDGAHTKGVLNGCLASPRYGLNGKHIGVTGDGGGHGIGVDFLWMWA
jgi:hypothetical protein